MLRLRASIRALMLVDPRVYWLCMPAIRSVKRLSGRLLLLASGTPRDRHLSIDRLLWLSPSRIEFKTLLKGSVFRHMGCGWVIGGDWDRLEHAFARDARFRAMQAAIEESVPWQNTDEYAAALSTIEQGSTAHHCRTREELDERFRLLEKLIEDIRRDGYLTQSELCGRRSEAGTLGRNDEVAVAIGRCGDILYRDGAHRLAIAKLLGVPTMPVQVAFRHEQWMDFRQRIEAYTENHGGRTPQPLLHPDLDNIPSAEVCVARYDMIVGALAPRSRIIDLAPGWGYFCQRLSSDGYACCALETSRENAEFLEVLRLATKSDFATMAPDSLGGLPDIATGFDVGLMLSDGLSPVVRSSPVELISYLQQVRPTQLFVEPLAFCGNGDILGARSSDSFEPGDLLKALIETGRYSSCERLGHTGEAGDLFRLM
jgi:hypothetical protein